MRARISIRGSVHLSIRPSVRPSVTPVLKSHLVTRSGRIFADRACSLVAILCNKGAFYIFFSHITLSFLHSIVYIFHSFFVIKPRVAMEFLNHCPCPTIRDWSAVYPALFLQKREGKTTNHESDFKAIVR